MVELHLPRWKISLASIYFRDKTAGITEEGQTAYQPMLGGHPWVSACEFSRNGGADKPLEEEPDVGGVPLMKDNEIYNTDVENIENTGRKILLTGTCWYELTGLGHQLSAQGYGVYWVPLGDYCTQDCWDLIIIALSAEPAMAEWLYQYDTEAGDSAGWSVSVNGRSAPCAETFF